jgi:hypothetical protein
MKKVTLILSMIFLTIVTKAQIRNLNYPLLFTNPKLPGVYISGMYFRNDTLFINLASGINVISVQNEGDSVYRSMFLKIMREKGPICNYYPNAMCTGLILNDSAYKKLPKLNRQ